MLSGAAPTTETLIAARALQGVAAALLVPGSLAIISASFHPLDRGAAIGAWSGLAGVSTAIGPFLGGWLIDSFSWRLVFFINPPIVVVTAILAYRHIPETRDETASRHVDVLGGTVLALGLAGVVYALIEGPAHGWAVSSVALAIIGVAALMMFVVIERRSPAPMVPLEIFRSRQFSGANAVTFVVYGALGGVTFLLVVHLQTDLGYSALKAGASLIPLTVLMLAFSSRMGALSQRIGPRIPMTVGPIIVGIGVALLARVQPGTTYWTTVFPAALVLGAGLTITVAPLTTAVLAAVEDRHAGIGPPSTTRCRASRGCSPSPCCPPSPASPPRAAASTSCTGSGKRCTSAPSCRGSAACWRGSRSAAACPCSRCPPRRRSRATTRRCVAPRPDAPRPCRRPGTRATTAPG